MSALRKASNPFEALGVVPATAPSMEPVAPPPVPPTQLPEPPRVAATGVGLVDTPVAAAAALPAPPTAEPARTRDVGGPSPASWAQPELAEPVRPTTPPRALTPRRRGARPAERSEPALEQDDRPRRTERLQINVTRRTKVLLQAEEIERRKRGLKPRQRDETTLVEQAIDKAYGHLWRDYSSLLGDEES